MTGRIEKMLNIAKKLSYKSSYKYKIGTVIAKGNEVVGLGFNAMKTHPKSNSRFKNIHSELSAILNTRREDLTGCTAYIYREDKNGKKAIAKPCASCRVLLQQIGIKEVVYTSTAKGIEKELL